MKDPATTKIDFWRFYPSFSYIDVPWQKPKNHETLLQSIEIMTDIGRFTGLQPGPILIFLGEFESAIKFEIFHVEFHQDRV